MSGAASSEAGEGTARARVHFERLADAALGRLLPGEDATVKLLGESSSFVRFNVGKVRQAGEVSQQVLTLRLIDGGRQAAVETTLSGDLSADLTAIDTMLGTLRGRLPSLPFDPQLLLGPPSRSNVSRPGALPPVAEMVETLLDLGKGLDLVGFLAAGPVCAGLRSSQGHDHWYEASSVNVDWCLYHGGGGSNLAVKAAYAGDRWDTDVVAAKISTGRARLALLARTPRVLSPGTYRTWLEPAAVEELLRLVNGWEGFSYRAVRTATSPLIQLHQGRQRLSPLVHLAEASLEGVSPRFDDEGFVCPDEVPLVRAGEAASLLVSSRTAREYGVPGTGAGAEEAAVALRLGGGELAEAEVLRALGTGIFVSNLWYLNWSDRNAARVTGMTRFASFWVENGEIVAPIAAMRLDDTLYRMFGSELEQLGQTPETMLSSDTYFRRATDGVTAPGALVRGVTYTL